MLFKCNFDPGLTLTYSIAGSILQLKTFYKGKCDNEGFIEKNASYDLEFG